MGELHELLAAAWEGDTEAVRRLAGDKAALEEVDGDRRTALLRAAYQGHKEAVHVLVSAYADTRHADDAGNTALILAGARGHVEVVQYLMEQTMQPEVARCNAAGMNVLHAAARRGHVAVVAYLIEGRHCDTEHPGQDGMTALLLAARYGHLPLARYLVDVAHTRLLQSDRNKWTALLWAAFAGHLDVVQYLVGEKKTSQRQVSLKGFTALMCAAAGGREEVAQYLLEQRNTVEKQNKAGFTALLIACSKGHLPVVHRLLFHWGADAQRRTATGTSALDLAHARESKPLEDLLVLFGCADHSDDAWKAHSLHHNLSESAVAAAREAAEKGSLHALWLLHCNHAAVVWNGRELTEEEMELLCLRRAHPTALLRAAERQADCLEAVEMVKLAKRAAAKFQFLNEVQRKFHAFTESRACSECRYKITARHCQEGKKLLPIATEEQVLEKLLAMTTDDTVTTNVRLVRAALADCLGSKSAINDLFLRVMTVLDEVKPVEELKAVAVARPVAKKKRSKEKAAPGHVERVIEGLKQLLRLLKDHETKNEAQLEAIAAMGLQSFDDTSSVLGSIIEKQQEERDAQAKEMDDSLRQEIADSLTAILEEYQQVRADGQETMRRAAGRIYTLQHRWRRLNKRAAEIIPVDITRTDETHLPRSSSSRLRFHELLFQQEPSGVGTGLMVAALYRVLSGETLLPSCLFATDIDGVKRAGSAKPTTGLSLQFLLESHPEMLEHIDMPSFSALTLLSVLVRPKDTRLDNIDVAVDLAPASAKVVALGNASQAFASPLVQIHSTETVRAGQPFAQCQCSLWFLPQMHLAVDGSFRRRLLSKPAETLLIEWLNALSAENHKLEQFLNEEVLSKAECTALGLPAACPPAMATSLLDDLRRVQLFLLDNDEATNWQLVELMAPSLALYYQQVRALVESSYQEADAEDALAHSSRVLLDCRLEMYRDAAPSLELLDALATRQFDCTSAMAEIAIELEALYGTKAQPGLSVEKVAEDMLMRIDGSRLSSDEQLGLVELVTRFPGLSRLSFKNLSVLDDQTLDSLMVKALSYDYVGVKHLRLSGTAAVTVGGIESALRKFPGITVALEYVYIEGAERCGQESDTPATPAGRRDSGLVDLTHLMGDAPVVVSESEADMLSVSAVGVELSASGPSGGEHSDVPSGSSLLSPRSDYSRRSDASEEVPSVAWSSEPFECRALGPARVAELLVLHRSIVLQAGGRTVTGELLKKGNMLLQLAEERILDGWLLALFHHANALSRETAQQLLDVACVTGNFALLAALEHHLRQTTSLEDVSATLLLAKEEAKRHLWRHCSVTLGDLPDASPLPASPCLSQHVHHRCGPDAPNVLAALQSAGFRTLADLRHVPNERFLSAVTGLTLPRCTSLLPVLSSPQPSAKGQYRRRALVVAVATAQSPYAEVDGLRVSLALGWLGFEVTCLLGERATRTAVLDGQWRLLTEAAAEGGVQWGLLQCFFGDVYQEEKPRDAPAYLRLHGFSPAAPHVAGIAVTQWAYAANDSSVHHVLSMLDYWGAGVECCSELARERIAAPAALSSRDSLLAAPGRHLIVAAVPSDVSPTHIAHERTGAFAKHLLEAVGWPALQKGAGEFAEAEWMGSEEMGAAVYRRMQAAENVFQFHCSSQSESSGSLLLERPPCNE